MNTWDWVLLVDDDEVNHFIHKKLLEKSGYEGEIYTAMNGKEGLESLSRLKEEQPNARGLVLLDLRMPELDGFGFLKACNEDNGWKADQIRIVPLSSSIHQADKNRVSDLGCFDYFEKPLSIEAFRSLSVSA
jgi:CheY-like chemotaxis protein